MGTIQPRARGGSSLGETLKGNRKDREQIRRQRVDIPKPKPAPVSSGGIVGMAEIVSTDGTVSMPAGQALIRNGVTYQAPRDAFAGSPGAASVAVGSWCSVSGYQISLTPGWYNLAVTVRVAWSVKADAPPSLSLYMQGGWDVAHNDWSIFALADVGDLSTPRWGIGQVASHGPTYIGASDLVWLECRAYGASPTGGSTAGAIVWNITMLG